MTIVTEEFVLREALVYIANCLEANEIYNPASDEFIRGDEVRTRLATFARKLAYNELPNWIKWIQIQEDAKAAAKTATTDTKLA
jgi:hypothetical protein